MVALAWNPFRCQSYNFEAPNGEGSCHLLVIIDARIIIVWHLRNGNCRPLGDGEVSIGIHRCTSNMFGCLWEIYGYCGGNCAFWTSWSWGGIVMCSEGEDLLIANDKLLLKWFSLTFMIHWFHFVHRLLFCLSGQLFSRFSVLHEKFMLLLGRFGVQGYIVPANPWSSHSIWVLCARLVYCDVWVFYSWSLQCLTVHIYGPVILLLAGKRGLDAHILISIGIPWVFNFCCK